MWLAGIGILAVVRWLAGIGILAVLRWLAEIGILDARKSSVDHIAISSPYFVVYIAVIVISKRHYI